MASAPTWADTTEADLLPSADGGVALAERPGDLSGYGLPEQRGRFGDHALPGRPGGYPDGEMTELTASFAGAAALAGGAPAIGDTPEDVRTRGTAEPGTPDRAEGFSTARRSRAAAAKERQAARRKGRRRRRMMLAGVCLPAVVAAAAVAYPHYPGLHLTGANAGPQVPSSPAPSPAASAKNSPRPLGRWQHIGTRAEDPVPLALSQLFPAKFPADGTDFTRTAQLASTSCPREVFGRHLQAAVRTHSCSQVMRASYLSAGHKLMGTIGVLNLRTSADAGAVGKVTGSGEFIAQLTAHSGPTHNLAKGTGLEEAEVKGHYLIMTWVEFTTLHAPKTSAQKTQLRTFSADLINQTANVSLTTRMVTGNPQMP